MATNADSSAALIIAAMLAEERAAAWTADKSGIAISTFRRKLRGGGDFTIPEIIRIAEALGRHPTELLPSNFRIPHRMAS